jgi:hypothetical protein
MDVPINNFFMIVNLLILVIDWATIQLTYINIVWVCVVCTEIDIWNCCVILPADITIHND